MKQLTNRKIVVTEKFLQRMVYIRSSSDSDKLRYNRVRPNCIIIYN